MLSTSSSPRFVPSLPHPTPLPSSQAPNTPLHSTMLSQRFAPSLPHPTPLGRPRKSFPLRVRAIDAAQPYDLESRLSSTLQLPLRQEPHQHQQQQEYPKLKIAVVGFGNFGQFLARSFVRSGHTVIAHSRTDHSSAAASLGASFFRDPHDLCEEHPDVLLLSTSILSAASSLRSLPLHRLRRNTLFVDVLSVKEFSRSLLLQMLPPHFDILCTHPMFGPESGKHGWTGLPFVFDKVRIHEDHVGGSRRAIRCEAFLEIFRKEGCKMVEMSCAEHDQHAAASQFITHTVGRVLSKMGLEETPIGTKGYERLLQLVDNTCQDSFDLYYGLFMYNKNSTELLDKMEAAFDSVKKELLGKLHDVVRKQLFESGPGDALN